MSDMVERVAKAQAGARWDQFDDEHKIAARELAYVAIAAMREPTDEMKNCSEEVHWGYSCHVCGGLAEGWQKMIDAALVKVDA